MNIYLSLCDLSCLCDVIYETLGYDVIVVMMWFRKCDFNRHVILVCEILSCLCDVIYETLGYDVIVVMLWFKKCDFSIWDLSCLCDVIYETLGYDVI
jgi:predicted subunit of tRNA(5-methylaminomethyl-2-thiouridylate) methyltransferase